MGGWLNFSSDHVEPIKADHGTQPPPPTSSTFFRSLFISAPRAGLYPPSLSAPRPSQPHSERARSLSRICPLPSLGFSAPSSRTSGHPQRRASSAFHLVFLLSPLARSLARPPALRQLVGFFRVTRWCNLFGRGRERHPRRWWSTKCARGLRRVT